ncbi:UDP-glucose 4-epimerase-like protein [Leptotrombidium deliense]|uniref:UDP-glucose 4-epimerase n=1 Tax=Leptotrombidium deliense TaxID=299467 RepID=A0A443SJ69_9ACAR|nr:UDP-glucose 4-epimerase-like protein [Leptotrombidium deliense]
MAKLVCVTGGAGFVGSHTVLELLDANYDVVVIDNLSNAVCNEINQNSLPESLKRVERLTQRNIQHFYNTDLLDEKSLDYIFSNHRFDTVIHFAALKAVGESCRIPLDYYRNNVGGTINLLDAMKKHGVNRIIFSSSSTVYGDPKYLPLDELHPTGNQLTNPYGRTKYFIEEILNDVCRSEKSWCVVHLRYFNPVGAHESGEIGEDPQGIPNNLMPYICQVAVGRHPHLNVYGNDFDTCDGTGVRDYIHIMDLAKGHVMAMDRLCAENWTGVHVYNLGTGRGYSVLEVITAFEKATNVKVPYKITQRRQGDIDANFADASKALEKFGWKSQYSIEDMCRDSWNWQSKYPYGYKNQCQNIEANNGKSPYGAKNGHN